MHHSIPVTVMHALGALHPVATAPGSVFVDERCRLFAYAVSLVPFDEN
ncbi:MAG TPA: hypothetical protein VF899_21200 [Pyrinomonadaceae bacterium]